MTGTFEGYVLSNGEIYNRGTEGPYTFTYLAANKRDTYIELITSSANANRQALSISSLDLRSATKIRITTKSISGNATRWSVGLTKDEASDALSGSYIFTFSGVGAETSITVSLGTKAGQSNQTVSLWLNNTWSSTNYLGIVKIELLA